MKSLEMKLAKKLSTVPNYTYITRQHQLDLAAGSLGSQKRIAVDTESSGFYTYFPELCLIQISSAEYHFLIDTLAGLDLSSLAEIFYDRSIQKIFHSAQSDIIEMNRDCGWTFHNVQDTYLAARILGIESCSLMNIAKQYCGAELEKKEQKSNWKKRPLTKSQLDYAHLDTAYLESIWDRMKEELEQKGLLEEYLAEMEFLENEYRNPEENQEKSPPEDGWLKVQGLRQLSSEEQGIVRDLYLFRESNAKNLNIAPFRLFTNQMIFSLAGKKPGSARSLLSVTGNRSEFLRRNAEQMSEIIQKALPAEKRERRNTGDFDPEAEELFKRLKKWRTVRSEKRGVESSIILSNRVLKIIAKEKPGDLSALAGMNLMSEWKKNQYGKEILEVLEMHAAGRASENSSK